MTCGILFDLDETLLDRTASISDYARQFHSDFQEHISVAPETFLVEFLRMDANGYVPREVFFDRLAGYIASSQVGSRQVSAHFAEKAWRAPILMEGAKEGLMQIRSAGIPVGIITNGGSRNQRKKLENTGLDQLVDTILISEEFGVKKPDTSIFHAACERLRIQPSGTWFVGDNPVSDIVGASIAGLQTIWLRRSLPWPADCPACHTCTVATLREAFEAIHRSI